MRNDKTVFDFGEADQRRQFSCLVGYCNDCLCNAVAFAFKALPGPVPFATGREFIVILQRVVEGIEKVFDVPEHYYKGSQSRTYLPPHIFAVSVVTAKIANL